MATVHSGASDAALLIEQVQNQILGRFDSSVTLSRRGAVESVFEAWQSTDERWKLNADEVAIPEEVKDASIRFIQNLPLASHNLQSVVNLTGISTSNGIVHLGVSYQ
jgi:hypothetical protein